MSPRKSLFTELANLSPSKQVSEKQDNTAITPVITPVRAPEITGAAIGVTTPATSPVTPGATTPGETPLTTGVETPVAQPASTPLATPVTQPVITPLITPVETGLNQPGRWGQTLDSTHTLAEGKVYSIMYRETISKGSDTKRFSIPWLMTACGIRADSTV